MENQKNVINWALDNSDVLNLKAEYYTGLRKIFDKIYDIGIYITINGNDYFGRGTDFVEEVAFCKGLSEAIERSCLEIFNIDNTNGLAVHFDLNLAKLNAKSELLERDAFFCHFLLSKGFHEYSFPHEFNLDFFNNLNLEVKFYEMCKYTSGTGVMCVIDGLGYKKPFGKIFGSAFSDNVPNAFLKSFLEALRFLMHILNQEEIEKINEVEFEKIFSVKFSDHGKLALDLDYSRKIGKIITSDKISISHCNESLFSFEEFDMSKFPIANVPLCIVRSSHPLLQKLYIGKTLDSDVNLERLRCLVEQDIKFSDVNKMIHPFD